MSESINNWINAGLGPAYILVWYDMKRFVWKELYIYFFPFSNQLLITQLRTLNMCDIPNDLT